jgi:hypothetical protein
VIAAGTTMGMAMLGLGVYLAVKEWRKSHRSLSAPTVRALLGLPPQPSSGSGSQGDALSHGHIQLQEYATHFDEALSARGLRGVHHYPPPPRRYRQHSYTSQHSDSQYSDSTQATGTHYTASLYGAGGRRDHDDRYGYDHRGHRPSTHSTTPSHHPAGHSERTGGGGAGGE